MFTYAGALSPVSTDKFVTSLFKDESGHTFCSIDEEERIVAFEPLTVSGRALVSPEQDIQVKIGSETVYSFFFKKKLIAGTRRNIQSQLVVLLESNELSVHAKLLLSSFLNLFQKTIELVGDSNRDLKRKGIEAKISDDIVFSKTVRISSQGNRNILELVRHQFSQLSESNRHIRPQDVTFFKAKEGYFRHLSFNLEEVINDECLNDRELDEIVNEALSFCAQQDIRLLSTLINDEKLNKFVLKSRYVQFDQHELECFLSNRVKHNAIPCNASIFDIGYDLDKEIHAQDSEETVIEDKRLELELEKSYLTIINDFKVPSF